MSAVPPGLLPRRMDARRNREVILRVAVEAFSRGGELVSLDDIARRAGLGRATVYRHFPDRTALGFAVAAERLAALAHRMEGASFRELFSAVLTAFRSSSRWWRVRWGAARPGWTGTRPPNDWSRPFSTASSRKPRSRGPTLSG